MSEHTCTKCGGTTFYMACKKCEENPHITIVALKTQRDDLLERLKESTEQLDAMSTSASHAASWVNPNSDATDIQVAKNRAAIANAERSEG